jgi:hypothetical protein
MFKSKGNKNKIINELRNNGIKKEEDKKYKQKIRYKMETV